MHWSPLSLYLSLYKFIKQHLKRWGMHQLRLHNTGKWNTFGSLEHHHSAAVLLTSSTQPNFMLLTLPTQETRYLYLRKGDVDEMEWNGKIFGYTPPSPLIIKCLGQYLSITIHFGTPPPLLLSFVELVSNRCILSKSDRWGILIIQLKLNAFSALFLYHGQNWGSSYTPTRYFQVQSSLGKL